MPSLPFDRGGGADCDGFSFLNQATCALYPVSAAKNRPKLAQNSTADETAHAQTA